MLFCNVYSQERGTIKVQNPHKIVEADCFDLGIHLGFYHKDTLRLKEFNEVHGIFTHTKKTCYEYHKYTILSYSIEIPGKWKKQTTGPELNSYAKNIIIANSPAKVIVTNCVINASSLNKKDSVIIIPETVFYVVKDN
jgi:hypothetical protein